MLFRIDHETRFTYSEPVIESVMEIRMSPLSNEDQTVLGYKLKVVPSVPITEYRDGFGNRVEMFNVMPQHSEILIRASSCTRCHRRSPDRLKNIIHNNTTNPADEGVFPIALEAMEFLRYTPLTRPNSEVLRWFATLPPIQGNNLYESASQLMDIVRTKLRYEKQVTTTQSSVAEVIRLGQGVCQDFTHLFIALARFFAISCRYVSGYVHQAGELATHAWCQIWGGAEVGWVDLDPTRGKWIEDEYIIAAIGRDYNDVPPNRGVWRGANVREMIQVNVLVQIVDKVPNDLLELTAPAWVQQQQQSSERGLNNNSSGLYQQIRRLNYRQQQSQQQQTDR